MKAMRFFFYGTLIADGGNAVTAQVHTRLRTLGAATVRGRLYAIPDPAGWYPALLPGAGEVRGELYETLPGFTPADVAALDGYEDCDPSRPLESLYLRKPVPVRLGGRPAGVAEAYLFNLPLMRGSLRIADGNFAHWLGKRGGRAFAGR